MNATDPCTRAHRAWPPFSFFPRPGLLLAWAAWMLFAAPAAPAHADGDLFAGASVPQLKSIYLHCADVSANAVLHREAMAACASAAESLRVRAFGGDLEQMLAWWKEARLSRSTASRPQVPR